MPDASSFGVSAPAGLGDRERDQSPEGGVVGVEPDGGTTRPPVALESGAMLVVAAAAINIVLKDGEGEGMRDMGVEEGFVSERKDGGSAK